MSLDEIYQEVILDHFRHPRCAGTIEHAPYQTQLFNPLCGDQIALSLKLEGEVLAEIGFVGHGCSISQAAASIMASSCKGKTMTQAREMIADFRSMMRGERDAEELVSIGDGAALQGVRKFSARVKCASLAWEALEKCLDQAAAA